MGDDLRDAISAIIRRHMFGDDIDIPSDECNCCADEVIEYLTKGTR